MILYPRETVRRWVITMAWRMFAIGVATGVAIGAGLGILAARGFAGLP